MRAGFAREPWRAQAACQGAGPDLFFPPDAGEAAAHATWSPAPAQAVCATCPVRTDCLDWAVATRQPDGVWGGLDPSEVRRLWRRSRSSHARAS